MPPSKHATFHQVSRRREPTSVSLVNIPLTIGGAALPRDVAVFLREAERRIEAFGDLCRFPGFVPSDYAQVYHALGHIAGGGMAPGNLFCEWGSGFGVVACLAAMTGFRAWGIEIEPALVDAARGLASDFGLDVNFLCDSYLPRGCCEYLDSAEPSLYLVAQPGDVREQWGLGPEDFDLFFAYPGPDDDQTVAQIFGRFSGTGAALLTYHGRDGLRLRRKVLRRRRTRGARRRVGRDATEIT